jgi:hypothetical protein
VIDNDHPMLVVVLIEPAAIGAKETCTVAVAELQPDSKNLGLGGSDDRQLNEAGQGHADLVATVAEDFK